MIEILNGVREDGKEMTTTIIAREGELIRKDLPKAFVRAYDNNDERVRSLVERVEITTEVDEDTGEETEVVTAVGKPESSESDDYAGNDEALLEHLRELEDELATAQSELAVANEAAANALTYDSLSAEALQAEVVKRGLTVSRADGKEGDPLKSDNVQALTENDATA